MPQTDFTDTEILGYLDESLPAARMTAIEASLRESESLRQRAAMLLRRRDDGFHSVGDIWRRSRLSCPGRRQLGGYLLETLDKPLKQYIDFHIQTIGCRYCAANLRDLEESMNQTPAVEERRRKFFQSSAGHVRNLRNE